MPGTFWRSTCSTIGQTIKICQISSLMCIKYENLPIAIAGGLAIITCWPSAHPKNISATPFETILQLIGNHDCLGAKIPPLEVAAFLMFIQAKPYIDMDFPHQHASLWPHST